MLLMLRKTRGIALINVRLDLIELSHLKVAKFTHSRILSKRNNMEINVDIIIYLQKLTPISCQ